ncbi:MAG: hypothetical protein HYZ63_02560 [Candidatus Andersenbacteria bacterium]|nr:hypothetical protein [Candidatus Andersenbacteria bacterium]
MIITRPEYDPSTRYLSAWSKSLIDTAEKKGLEVIDLHKEKAAKNEFEGRVKKKNPSLVVLNGHGTQACVTGHNNEVLVEAGKNSYLLAEKVTYAVSCSSAAVLGEEVAITANTAYIGYRDDFVFPFSQQYVSKPLSDKRAGRCLEVSNQVVLSLLKGNSCSESVGRSKQLAQKHISSLLTSNAGPEAAFDARILWWNLQQQVCLGDGSKTI